MRTFSDLGAVRFSTALRAQSPCAVARRRHVPPIDTNALATLAVQDHGRKKPFTTFAQEMLLAMSGTTARCRVENPDGSKTDAAAGAGDARSLVQAGRLGRRPVIMLNFLELKKKLGLPRRTSKLFSFNELIKQPALIDAARRGAEDAAGRTRGQADRARRRRPSISASACGFSRICVNGEQRDDRAASAASRRPWLPIQNSARSTPRLAAVDRAALLHPRRSRARRGQRLHRPGPTPTRAAISPHFNAQTPAGGRLASAPRPAILSLRRHRFNSSTSTWCSIRFAGRGSSTSSRCSSCC